MITKWCKHIKLEDRDFSPGKVWRYDGLTLNWTWKICPECKKKKPKNLKVRHET